MDEKGTLSKENNSEITPIRVTETMMHQAILGSKKHSGLKVVGIAPFYPTVYRPESGIFCHSLFEAMRSQSIHVDVIAPLPWTQRLLDSLVRRRMQWNASLNQNKLLRPKYSNLPLHIMPSARWAHKKVQQNFQHAVRDAFREINKTPDWVYAHFFTSGYACLDICAQLDMPCIVGLGESNLSYIEHLVGVQSFAGSLRRFSGLISVSQENEHFCRERCPDLDNKLIYIPNGVDTTKFYVRDRSVTRRQLSLPLNSRIAVFSGHFIQRKGPYRVLKALESLPDVYGVFLGQGKQVPRGSRVLHAGAVFHDQMPLWLSAADVFVLPSLAEGMSNAILEALASGLPVVVSDLPFNRDFLSADCAVFVDPLSPLSIADGIKYVLEDPMRWIKMSKAAVCLARQYSLSSRVQKIVDFSNSLM